ncbi:MAG: hypothetical protein LBP25_02615 [Tannerellaceae bacterium]|jgi:IS5 family transposase|nr:hypothetical protein [Tannerellaceae bacterium]
MTEEQKRFYKERLGLYKRAVNQQRSDKNKVYSLHKPFTECISKGKAHKQYEFGNKIGLITGGKKGKKIILAIKGFIGNPFDGHTIEPLLNQIENNKIALPKELAYVRPGWQGKIRNQRSKNHHSVSAEKERYGLSETKKRKQCRVGAGIESIISHLKYDFRIPENYFWGEVGVQINAFMSGTAWNLKKMMQKLREEFLRIIFRLFFPQDFCCSAA